MPEVWSFRRGVACFNARMTTRSSPKPKSSRFGRYLHIETQRRFMTTRTE